MGGGHSFFSIGTRQCGMVTYDRIVSLAPSNTDILYALGVGERVVATTGLCDRPPAATELPSVGGWTTPDVDAVQAHDPDLVLASDALQDDAVAACRAAGLTVRQLTPRTFEDVFNTVKAVGELVDAEDAARDMVEEMNGRMQELAVRDPDSRPRVYCEEWHDPPMVAGNWVPDLVRLAGGEPLNAGGARSEAVDADAVAAFDPAVVVLHHCGAGDRPDAGAVADRDGWSGIAAVRDDAVHVVDDALLNRPGPRLLDGLERLCGIIDEAR